MTEEREIEINSRLISFNGAIGRHDYILNIVYLCIIQSIFTIPYVYWYIRNAGTISELVNINSIIHEIPPALFIWLIVGTIAILPISISNAIRRINDIIGGSNNILNIISAVIITIISFSYVFSPLIATILLFPVSFLLAVILMCVPGKITGKQPYDVTKIFNWGAFFGTWIWGLINKAYVPLWYLLLWFTPFNFYFQMICGLKGNEWAYNKLEDKNIEKFNQSQRTQATVWSVLSIVVFPILYFILVFVIIAGFAIVAAIDNPQTTGDKVDNAFEKVFNGFSSVYFESHEITENENKFYVLPEDWAGYSFTDKKDILDFAASMASMERNKQDSTHYYSKTSELKRTKIYSSTDGQLLGEFVIDDSALENASFKEYIKSAIKAYRFYRPAKK